MNHKLNLPVAGYHLLLILTHSDGEFAKEEGDIIIRYLSENFPFRTNLDEEIEFLATLPRESYEDHFRKAMNDFYEDSTAEERDQFLDFAVKLVKADDVITQQENIFLNMLFNSWVPEFEEEN
jgi:hypothetical protein